MLNRFEWLSSVRLNIDRLSNAKAFFCRSSFAFAVLSMVSLLFVRSAVSQQLVPVWGPTTVVGNGTSGDKGDGGPAVNAELTAQPQVAVDKAGNLYIDDPTNHVIRKVDTSGIISTIAGTAGTKGYTGDGGPATAATLNTPDGVALDNNGNLLIADRNNYAIRRIDAVTGIITTVAGSGKLGTTGDGGPATAATLNGPYTVTCDRYGNIYIPDSKANTVRKVDTAGIITTIAGTGKSGYTGDGGPATAATFNALYGAWLDLAGNLYISDVANNVVRMIDTSGNIHTVAGNNKTSPANAGDGGPATSAVIYNPRPLVVDNAGNLYIPDQHDQTVRMVNGNGTITTIAGTGVGCASATAVCGDGGPGPAAQFNTPYGLGIDSSNNLYVVDSSDYRVRRLSLNTGFASTLVGASATQNFIVQSATAVTPNTAVASPASPAEFSLGGLSGCTLGASLTANTPCTIPITFTPTAPGLQTAQLKISDASGNFSTFGFTGVGIAPETTFSNALIDTIAGTGTAGNAGAAGPATSAQVNAPRGGSIDSAGNVYFADSGNNVIRRIDATTGAISSVAGSGSAGFSGDGSAATSAQLNAPAKVVVDAAGDLYIADTLNSVIRFVNASDGKISTIAGTAGTASYTGDKGPATAATLNRPQGLAVDLGGGIYVADTGNSVVRFFAKGGAIVTVAGTGTAAYSGDGGNALSAALSVPQAVQLDGLGNVYIADTGNDVVRMISARNQISTVAGQQGSNSNSGDGGAATAGTLSQPSDITLDAAGDLYIASGGQIRLVNTSGTLSTLAGTGATGNYSGEGGAATSAVLPSPASNLMLDSAGDVFVAGTAANRLLKVSSAIPVSLNMGIVPAGSTGTPQTFSVQNTGNSALNISGLAASSGFTLQTGAASACTSTTSLTSGQSCSLTVVFTPALSANGAVSGTLTLTDNALNGTGATQVFALSGTTKVISSTTLAVTTSPTSPVYGGSATITAIVNNGTSPAGSVSFTANGTSIGSSPLNNGQATIVLPSLPAGTVQVGASYGGDANNSSSVGTDSVTVQPAMLTVTATNATMAQGGALPTFAYTLAGFVNGDTSAVVTGAPAETTTASSSSPQGAYPITIAVGTLVSLNYTFMFVSGTLTVLPPLPPDFTLAVTPSSTSAPAGQTGLVTLTLTPVRNYTGTVSISCTSAPQSIGCTSTGPLTSDGKDPAYTQLKLFAANQTGMLIRGDGAPRSWLAFGMPLCFVGLALSRRRKWTGRLLLLLFGTALTTGLSSCAGNSTPTAAKGTYQVTVTAADSAAQLSHTATFTFTIQ